MSNWFASFFNRPSQNRPNQNDEMIEQYIAEAMVEIQRGNLEKAWLRLQLAYESGGKNNASVHVGFGIVYDRDQKTMDKAFAAYNYAVTCNPALPQAYSNRGRVLLMAGELDEAMNDFQKAIQLQPENVRGYFNIGGVYLQRNEPEKSLEYFEKALKLGYAPAQQALDRAKMQILTKQASPNVLAFMPPDQREFLKCTLLLANFAYQHHGPSQKLTVVNTSGTSNQKEEIQSAIVWSTAIENFGSTDGKAFKKPEMGATLEMFTPSRFLIRITRPSQDYQLTLIGIYPNPGPQKKFAGMPDEIYGQQKEHNWLLPYEMLAPKLAELVKTGVFKKNEHGLITYPLQELP